MISVIYVIFLLVDILITFLAPNFLPFNSRFAFNTSVNNFFNTFANFDGVHYLNIAQFGYRYPGEYAFFPFFPLLIRIVTFFTKNYLFSGLLISQILLLCALKMLQKYLSKFKFDKADINWFLIFLVVFPTSFYLHAVYSESLFLWILISYLYFLKKRNYIAVAGLGLIAGTTKIVGVLLIIPAFIHFLFYKKTKFLYWKTLIAFTPLFGLLTYCIFLYLRTGDPFKFLHVMSTFGEQRKGLFVLFPQVIYRYFKIFIYSQYNFQYFIALLEFVIFTGFLFLIIYICFKLYRKNTYLLFTFGIFSLINLMLPSLSGSFSSIPRYAIMSLISFIPLMQIKNVYFKSVILFVFLLLHVILLTYFTQGYFVS